MALRTEMILIASSSDILVQRLIRVKEFVDSKGRYCKLPSDIVFALANLDEALAALRAG